MLMITVVTALAMSILLMGQPGGLCSAGPPAFQEEQASPYLQLAALSTDKVAAKKSRKG